MEIKAAKITDLKTIAEIFLIESAKEPYLQVWNEESSLEKINFFYESNDLYVVFVDEEIVGFIACELTLDKKLVYVSECWLKEQHQHKGLGTKLMQFIEEEYKNQGMKSISLVTDKRSNAFKFYKKLGYKNHKTLMFLEKEL